MDFQDFLNQMFCEISVVYMIVDYPWATVAMDN